MRKISLAITGMGNVGRRLLELIQRKHEIAASRFDIELVICGICDFSGSVLDANGVDIDQVLSAKENKRSVCTLRSGVSGMRSAEFMENVRADLLVELTPTNLKDGEPGLGAIRTALSKSMHVVSANKGPLVMAFSELTDLANTKCKAVIQCNGNWRFANSKRWSARDLCIAVIHKVEGILNGTTNYILTKMFQGQSYSDALKKAQEIGMAETDPSLDVDGWDAACKLVIIGNAVLKRRTTLSDINVEGISGVTMQQLEKASSENHIIKLVALAEKTAEGYRFSVKPTSLPRTHRLATINGGMMGVIYQTDINGQIFLCIDEEDPYPTAAAVLRDIIHIAAEI